jgi:hypothetical protein
MNNHERPHPLYGEIESLNMPFKMYKNHQNQNLENRRVRFQNDFNNSNYESYVGNRLIFPGENFMFPFLCKVRHRDDEIKPVAGKSLWQRIYKVSEEISENLQFSMNTLNEASKIITAENNLESDSKPESIITQSPKNLDETPIQIEFDEEGNVKGPFTILRKEPTKFSTRQDVVNKTLIRSLKKYYTQLFRKESEFYTLRRNKDMLMKDYADNFANTIIDDFQSCKNKNNAKNSKNINSMTN